MLCRTLRLALLCALCSCGSTLVALRPPAPPRLRPNSLVQRARVSHISAQVVAEPPVKVPERTVQLEPTKPKGDKQGEKGKKYKLLLFNDNVNR